MKVLQFEQSSRPAASRTAAPADAQAEPDTDPARQRTAPEDPHDPDEPGYGHGV